jgi:hypothetical protein
MRTWITSKKFDEFDEFDGRTFDGERIMAPNIEEAKKIAEERGLVVVGELKCEVEDASPGKVIEAMRAAGAPEDAIEEALDTLRNYEKEQEDEE